jgi:hypothetical protein
MAMTSCPRCQGSGWVCETHRTQPINHRLQDGLECGGAGSPCEEPGCRFRTHPINGDDARKQKWRKPYVKGKVDVAITSAWILVLTLVAAMFWMAISGNRFCCDPDSLLLRLWRSSS